MLSSPSTNSEYMQKAKDERSCSTLAAYSRLRYRWEILLFLPVYACDQFNYCGSTNSFITFDVFILSPFFFHLCVFFCYLKITFLEAGWWLNYSRRWCKPLSTTCMRAFYCTRKKFFPVFFSSVSSNIILFYCVLSFVLRNGNSLRFSFVFIPQTDYYLKKKSKKK